MGVSEKVVWEFNRKRGHQMCVGLRLINFLKGIRIHNSTLKVVEEIV